MLAIAGTQQLPWGIFGVPEEPAQHGASRHLLRRSASRLLLRRGQRAAQRAASDRLSMACCGLLAAPPPRHIRCGQVVVGEGTHLQKRGGCKAGGAGWQRGSRAKAAAAAGSNRERGAGVHWR